ncbi:cytochrome P450 [Coprinopsis cinerea okayama7|uniref:Cytochrome P450 n=1 Tax=Coprinopsis cinerea (strain Okayama-7 / 130 / ATCC MYA-4618 / FGSC 9003) TaxID=240176 RepID=A8P027_COPC7|nr:cytochrome P450 [Coprinopsis cinerea okayama7\|eukprot:XP_001837807.2 cytochrome P450 [Coprinopsis cinerea okayama7\
MAISLSALSSALPFSLMGTRISLLDISAASLLLYCLIRLLASRRPPAPFPPGPRRLPLLGNILDMPSSQEWLTFTEWGQKWGDITSISIFGQEIVILNSMKAAVEMLDKKSLNYSDRPVMEMGGELVGWKNALVLTPYGDRFRRFRKMFHQLIGTHASMAHFHSVEEEETQEFLRALLRDPSNFVQHIRQTAGAIILRISHGYRVKPNNDPLVAVADEAMHQFALATAPGGFLVNLIPPLKHLPDWFPGAGFKQTAKEWRATINRMADEPYRYVKEQIAAGSAEPSFTSKFLEEPNLSEDREYDIKWSSASLYSGGADTTVSSIHALFLALCLFPEVHKKAQVEIDAVVGNDRLPTFEDRQNLPYINALVSEVLRWHAVTPTSVPHRVLEDDIHNGYFIPKGSLVIANVWNMLHDPRVYHNPMDFKPERFLGPTPEPDPRNACFGFGRRICPGRILADASVYISVAMLIATFNVSKAVKNGEVVEPPLGQTSGTVSHPLAFECTIKPRSQKAIDLIVDADD